MLRGLGLTLLCLTAIAVPAAAGGRIAAGQVDTTVAHQSPSKEAVQAAIREQLQSAWVSARSRGASSALRAGSAGGLRDGAVNRPAGSASALPQRPPLQDSVAFPWLKQSNSGVAVALTDRFRVGFGYRYVEGEDLWPEFADTGAAGYGSHHVLVRASWRF
jgi:hypothetical protein